MYVRTYCRNCMYFSEVIKIKFCKDEEEKKKLAEEFAEKKFPLYLQKTEGFLKKAGGQFFTNNGVS